MEYTVKSVYTQYGKCAQLNRYSAVLLCSAKPCLYSNVKLGWPLMYHYLFAWPTRLQKRCLSNTKHRPMLHTSGVLGVDQQAPWTRITAQTLQHTVVSAEMIQPDGSPGDHYCSASWSTLVSWCRQPEEA